MNAQDQIKERAKENKRAQKLEEVIMGINPIEIASHNFWNNVDFDGPVPMHVPDIGNCWLWNGAIYEKGYGIYNFSGVSCGAHRFSYALTNGGIDRNLLCCHKCDNRRCVRPDHLFAGTSGDNRRDSVNKGRALNLNSRKKYCLRGHSYSPENTKIDKKANGRTQRRCKTCLNFAQRIYRRSKALKPPLALAAPVLKEGE